MNQPKCDHTNLYPYRVITPEGRYIIRQATSANHAADRVNREDGQVVLSVTPVN